MDQIISSMDSSYMVAGGVLIAGIVGIFSCRFLGMCPNASKKKSKSKGKETKKSTKEKSNRKATSTGKGAAVGKNKKATTRSNEKKQPFNIEDYIRDITDSEDEEQLKRRGKDKNDEVAKKKKKTKRIKKPAVEESDISQDDDDDHNEWETISHKKTRKPKLDVMNETVDEDKEE